MKRFLGPCLVVLGLLLSGCADESSSTATDATDQTTPSPTYSDPPATEPLTVGIVHETAAGGEVDLAAVPMDDEEAWQAFTGQFERGSLPEKIGAAVGSATIPDGYAVWGAVVSLGCDVPTDVEVTPSGDGWTFDPQMPGKTMQECFAPVTSVALVALPAS